jgi:hypothetical protein
VTNAREGMRLATTAPDLPPVPGVHPAFARDFEYKRHGTLSLLTRCGRLSANAWIFLNSVELLQL